MLTKPRSAFCKRGHLLADTRRITPAGKTRCCICTTERAREARQKHPEQNRAAVAKYKRTDKGKLKHSAYKRTEKYKAWQREYDRVKAEAQRGGPPRYRWVKTGAFVNNKQAYHLRWLFEHKYGITLEQYNEMVELQGGRCAICNKEPRGTSHTSRRLAVDHDHVTGMVRGLLCGPCNTTIGMIEDSPGLLDRMRRYLGKHAQLRLVEK